MAYQFEVLQDNLLKALDSLVRRKPPIKEVHIEQLRTRIMESSHIPGTYLIRQLVEAGYTLEDIIDFLIEAGIITSEEDLVKIRPSLVRFIASLMKRSTERG